jgi:hypothetical protein
MRPIIQTASPTTASYNFPVIVPDINLTPGNANWLVSNNASVAAVITLWFSNDDPFAPNFPTNATWVQEQAAFQNSLGAVVGELTINNSSGVGAYAYLPRAMQFRVTNCASAVLTVRFVQASGGRS